VVVGHGRHIWCLQGTLLIFKGGWHHWAKWFHLGVGYLVWYIITTKSIVVYCFHCMEKFVSTFSSRPPMDDYHELYQVHNVEIKEWHIYILVTSLLFYHNGVWAIPTQPCTVVSI
jgi:hypothetical protein